jgi:hypothetical protein
MSPDDHITAQVAQHTSAVVRAIMAANRCGDPSQVAFDIVGAAVLIVGDSDQLARSALARLMMRLAEQLDHDVLNATTLQ